MKYRSLWAGLAALGAAALLLTLTLKKGAEGLLMWAFPMAQMGSLLRQLSMSGAVGNFVAWILYFAAVFGLHVLNREEVLELPMGGRIVRLLKL